MTWPPSTTDIPLPATTTSAAETLALGRRLATTLAPGDIVALYGDLGAGKTHLVKGVCEGFGVPGTSVTSPTFTLVNEYAGVDFPIYHFDAYRIERMEEFFELGYEDYFFGDGVCLIEWPEHIEPLLPEHTLRLRLAHLGGDERQIAHF
ncbi:MAG TPA: tRNA (adenosine(37)-N6)-threonylcarbamoyltransferase complex ATPase subunit type 1 TsaE [Rhodothermales bacterium]|nr:tRNA (adenosine(37)-N6)-threonylcarbamoyltransferase complex ATPase subunit type 1 TsaE [Rhodothermales bacterium]